MHEWTVRMIIHMNLKEELYMWVEYNNFTQHFNVLSL
jgi:hypothetical protein